MHSRARIEPILFTHPLYGWLGVGLLLMLSPLLPIEEALLYGLVVYLVSIGLVFFRKSRGVQRHSILDGGITLFLFSLVVTLGKAIAGLRLNILSYQFLLLTLALIVVALGAYRLRRKPQQLSSLGELCSHELTRLFAQGEYLFLLSGCKKLLLPLGLLLAFWQLWQGSFTVDNTPLPSFTNYLLPGLALGLYLFEVIRLVMLKRRLRGEAWLPLLDDEGKPIGRIARSEVCQLQQGGLPLIRLYALCKGCLYLEEGGDGRLETPFLTWQELGRGVSEQLQEMIFSQMDSHKMPQEPNVILRYKSLWRGDAKLFVTLASYRIASPCDLKKKSRARWWSLEELKSSRLSLSPFLESELPYLEESLRLVSQLEGKKKG